MNKQLGKITKVCLGFGGYQDVEFGITLRISFFGMEVQTFISENSKEDFVCYLKSLLKDSKKQDIYQLVGVPVEVTTDGNLLKNFRVLTEVIL